VHRFLGQTLEDHLYTNNIDLYDKIHSDLNGFPFSNVSVWADQVKRTKKYSWSRRLHYTDIDSCCISDDYSCDNCIFSAINDIIEHKNTHNLTREENIKFLLHFLQDINQPLHSFGYKKGGNQYKIIRNKRHRNRTMNLHAFFDNELPLYYIKNYYYEYTGNHSYSLTNIVNFNLYLACNYIYNIKDHFIIFEEYFDHRIIKSLFDNYMSLSLNLLDKYYT
jgi:hypothetical protein